MKTIEARIGDYGFVQLDVSMNEPKDADKILRAIELRLKFRTQGVACILRALLDSLGLARCGSEITLNHQGTFEAAGEGFRANGVTFISIRVRQPSADDASARAYFESQAVRLTDLVAKELDDYLRNGG